LDIDAACLLHYVTPNLLFVQVYYITSFIACIRLFAEEPNSADVCTDLLNELAVARGEGTFIKTMKSYKKSSLLILDEWLLLPLTDTQSRDVLEIVEVRHQVSSTIFCSQFSPEGWHSKIGESTLADAILDRIVHDL